MPHHLRHSGDARAASGPPRNPDASSESVSRIPGSGLRPAPQGEEDGGGAEFHQRQPSTSHCGVQQKTAQPQKSQTQSKASALSLEFRVPALRPAPDGENLVECRLRFLLRALQPQRLRDLGHDGERDLSRRTAQIGGPIGGVNTRKMAASESPPLLAAPPAWRASSWSRARRVSKRSTTTPCGER